MIAPPVHHCRAYRAIRRVWCARQEIAAWFFALVFLGLAAVGLVSCVVALLP